MDGYIVALRIARGVGIEGIEEAILEGEVDVAYGMYLLELLEREVGR